MDMKVVIVSAHMYMYDYVWLYCIALITMYMRLRDRHFFVNCASKLIKDGVVHWEILSSIGKLIT